MWTWLGWVWCAAEVPCSFKNLATNDTKSAEDLPAAFVMFCIVVQ